MKLKPDDSVSAQAVLRSSAGAAEAAAEFKKLGFEIGTVVANSFSVTAPLRVFESVFGVHLRATERGGIEAASRKRGVGALELPLDSLTSHLQKLLQTVTFTAPPDFGPTNW